MSFTIRFMWKTRSFNKSTTHKKSSSKTPRKSQCRTHFAYRCLTTTTSTVWTWQRLSPFKTLDKTQGTNSFTQNLFKTPSCLKTLSYKCAKSLCRKSANYKSFIRSSLRYLMRSWKGRGIRMGWLKWLKISSMKYRIREGRPWPNLTKMKGSTGMLAIKNFWKPQ